MANKFLKQVQIGTESTAGTAVTPTARWRGPGVMPDDQRTLVFPDENIGSIPGKDRSYTPMLKSSLALPETEATFEQLGYLLGACIKGAAGVQDGAGSDYVYTYDFPSTQPAITYLDTLSITGGDDQEQEQIEYAFVVDMVIRGRVGEALKVSANIEGRQSTLDNFETLSLPTVEEILTQTGKVYIDDADGTIGSTQVTESITVFELRIKSGWQARFTADGNLYFSHAKFTRPELELDITFEHDSDAVSEKANWRSETARLIRLQFEGADVGTPGTVYSKKTFRTDLAGKWSRFEPIGEDSDITISQGKFMVRENDTAALFAQLIVVNELSALP
jgi:hypothetical protein